MILLQEPKLSSWDKCSYIENLNWRFEYFFANDLTEIELGELLRRGWRKFGIYFFRPNCNKCYDCIPLRVIADKFIPSKSQRRIINKSSDIKVTFGPLNYKKEIYDIYKNHSENRFGKETDVNDFITNFYTESCESIQSEYYLEDKLIGVGFIDVADDALSSVYYIFDTQYEKYRPGTYSIIKEIEETKRMGLKYYYLGYYIDKNQSMSYKNRFHPNEHYNWEKDIWEEKT